jgi:hypothetical protein
MNYEKSATYRSRTLSSLSLRVAGMARPLLAERFVTAPHVSAAIIARSAGVPLSATRLAPSTNAVNIVATALTIVAVACRPFRQTRASWSRWNYRSSTVARRTGRQGAYLLLDPVDSRRDSAVNARVFWTGTAVSPRNNTDLNA